MSIDLMNRIWWREDIPTSEKMVLLACADRADDDDGSFWYANATIALKCSMTVRGIQKIIDRLIEKEMMTKGHRANCSNYFQINVDLFPYCKPEKHRPKEKSPNRDFGSTGEHGSDDGRTGFQVRVNRVPITPEPGSPNTKDDSRIESRDDSNVLSDDGESKFDLFGQPILSKEELKARQEDALMDFIKAGWHEIATTHEKIPNIEKINPRRRSAVLLRTEEFVNENRDAYELWQQIFDHINNSIYLQGHVKDWQVSFDWALGETGFQKLVEGNFRDKPGTKRPAIDHDTGRHLTPGEQAERDIHELLLRSEEQQSSRSARYEPFPPAGYIDHQG